MWTSGLNVSGIALRPLAVITISSGLGEGPVIDAIPTSEAKDASGVTTLPNLGTTLLVTVVAVTLSKTMTPRPRWRRLEAGDGGKNAGSMIRTVFKQDVYFVFSILSMQHNPTLFHTNYLNVIV